MLLKKCSLHKGISPNAQGMSLNAQGISLNAQGISPNAQGMSSNAQGMSSNAQAVNLNTQSNCKLLIQSYSFYFSDIHKQHYSDRCFDNYR
jgi:hypothetical protein